MIAWKNTLPATTKEGYAKELQLLHVCVTKYIKVGFNYGEAEKSKCEENYSNCLGIHHIYTTVQV